MNIGNFSLRIPIFAAGVAGILAAVMPAEGAVYYVRPTGSDANNGTSAITAWATIGKANSIVVAGDVVTVFPGTYSQSPNPTNSGTSYRSRITYVGDLANPSSTVVPGGDMNKRYVTLKGFRFSSGIGMTNAARYDSVAYSIINGDVAWSGNKFCMIYRCTLNGGRFVSGEKIGISTERDTLLECTLNLGAGVTSQPHLFETYDFTQYCVFERNRIFLTIGAGASDVHPRLHYHTSYCTFRDNYWEVVNNSTVTGWGTMVLRDSTSYNTFIRDTLIAKGPADCVIMLSGSGSYPNSCQNNGWYSCVFKNLVGTAAYFQNGCNAATFQNCVFASNGLALQTGAITGSTLIDHCTFFGSSGSGVANFDPDPDAAWVGTSTITNNIFYSNSTSNAAGSVGVFHLTLAFQGHLVENNNLFFNRGFGTSAGDRSIGWWTGGTTFDSKPGTGQLWYNTYGHDGASRYASPLFVDSTLAGFDAHLRAGSPAIGMGIGGTDVGAYAFSGGGDVTPPAAITTLAPGAIADRSVVLMWIAPGDDGNVGIASAYDLRYSTAPIAAGTFAAATPVAIQPVPLGAGSAQSYVLLGLTPDTPYYFAIKAQDEAGNWSAISNLPTARTLASDTTPPAAIQDLGTGF